MAETAKEHSLSAETRAAIIEGFLSRHGWQEAKRVPLAGDASFRKYERVFEGERHAILMDAPPEKEDVRPFINIADRLLENNLSAPRILATDAENGLLLLEDLGDDLFARILEKQPEREKELYHIAADVLIALYRNAGATADIPIFDMPRMLQQVSLLPEWFIPLVSGRRVEADVLAEYLNRWQETLAKLPDLKKVMVLYDFHAENILWLPERRGVLRAGLLDFQDAMMGSPAYDMVSFLEDARRDVSKDTVEGVIEHYLKHTGIPPAEFMAAYRLMGAQRNCRIVGTFSRLAVRDKKPRYLNYMQRVWQHVEHDLSHPLLSPVKEWMDRHIKPEWRK